MGHTSAPLLWRVKIELWVGGLLKNEVLSPMQVASKRTLPKPGCGFGQFWVPGSGDLSSGFTRHLGIASSSFQIVETPRVIMNVVDLILYYDIIYDTQRDRGVGDERVS